MISKSALDAFHKLVSIAGEPCECGDDNPCCRGCNARECLEEIIMEIVEVLEDIESASS